MTKILLADDHPVVRRGLREILREAFPHAMISETENAEALINEALTEDWDLVVCDLVMPGRTGLDALTQIKKIKPQLPVLIMSVHSETQYALRALRNGAAGYLKKDLAPQELVEAIHTALSGKKYITPTIAEKLASLLSEGDSSIELHHTLSDREFEVLKLIARGRSIGEIGIAMSLSSSTISTYRIRILTKLKLQTNADITLYASNNGLI